MTTPSTLPRPPAAPLPINAIGAAVAEDTPEKDDKTAAPSSARRDLAIKLGKEFKPEQIHYRAGPTTKQRDRTSGKYPEGTRTLALPYLDARDVEDRLDAAAGPWGWQDTYRIIDLGTVAVECGIGIQMEDSTWVWKFDVGYPNDAADAGDAKKEPLKAAYSDAFKRAAIKWRIGRHIYRMKPTWRDINERGEIV